MKLSTKIALILLLVGIFAAPILIHAQAAYAKA